MSLRHISCLTIILLVLTSVSPAPVLRGQDPCPGNPIANASMEEGARGTGGLGTRASATVADVWTPWSVWGYSPYSQEAEFDVEDITRLGRYSTYRVHSGRFSQKFSTTFGVHNAGIYQRVAVPKGSEVTFSIWVQIYTGQARDVSDANNELISDLNEPGNYRVYAGIDPHGEVPPGFGAGPSEQTVWSEPVLDRETRRFDEGGLPFDGWVQLQVQAKAEADHVTIYARGQPEFPVRANVSYWDDACLAYVVPTPEASPTPQFSATPEPTASPSATATRLPSPTATVTPVPTETLVSTETSVPTYTPRPTQTPQAEATSTTRATSTALLSPTVPATIVPTERPPAGSTGGGYAENPFLLLVFAALWLTAAGYIGWFVWRRRTIDSSG